MSAVLDSIPQFVQNGLVVAAGFIPALGISLLAQMILTKKLVIFFVLGFAISAYLKIPMLGVAIFATIIAIVLVGLQNNNVKKQEVMLDEDF